MNKKESKAKRIAIQIGYAVVLVGGFCVIMWWGTATHNPATQIEPCTTTFIKGFYTIKTMREHCPEVTKQGVTDAVNDYFDGGFDYEAHGTKQQMLKEIDEGFNQ